MKPTRNRKRFEGFFKICGKYLSFTLLELMVVISIVAVLAALLVPAVTSAKWRSKSAGCMSNLHQLGIAFQMYSNDWDGRVPRCTQDITDPNAGPYPSARWTIHMTWRKYLPGISTNYWQFPLSSSVYICPPDRDNKSLWGTDYATYQEWGGSHLYNVGLGIGASTLADGKIPQGDHAKKILMVDAATRKDISYPFAFATNDFLSMMTYDGMPLQNRHFRRSNALFFDWHVEAIDPNKVTMDQIAVQ